MVKSKEDVIAQFNEQVNMTAEELQKWLDNPESKKAGTGVGVDSGHKIIEILKRNPGKDPEKYEEARLRPFSMEPLRMLKRVHSHLLGRYRAYAKSCCVSLLCLTCRTHSSMSLRVDTMVGTWRRKTI